MVSNVASNAWDQLADSLMGADPAVAESLQPLPGQLLGLAKECLQRGDDTRAQTLRGHATEIEQHLVEPRASMDQQLIEIMDLVDAALRQERAAPAPKERPSQATHAACASSALLMLFADDCADAVERAEQGVLSLKDAGDADLVEGVSKAFRMIAEGAPSCGAEGLAPLALAAADLVSRLCQGGQSLNATHADRLQRTTAVLRQEALKMRMVVSMNGFQYDPRLIALAAEYQHAVEAPREVPAAAAAKSAPQTANPASSGMSAMLMLFTDDAAEYLDRAEHGLLSLEQGMNPATMQTVASAFQELQAGAALSGANGLIATARQAELLLSGDQAPGARQSDLLLRTIDLLRQELGRLRLVISAEKFVYDPRHNELIAEMSLITSDETPPAIAAVAAATNTVTTANSVTTLPETETLRDDLSAISGDPEMLAMFVSEAAEHLEAGERHLLALEACPGDTGSIDAVFRAFHSLKGTAGFVELHEIVGVAHHAEDLLDRVRSGSMALTGEALEAALASLDTLKRMVEGVKTWLATGAPLRRDPEQETLVRRLKRLLGGHAAVAEEPARISEVTPISAPTPAIKAHSQPAPAPAAVAHTAPAAATPTEARAHTAPNEAVKVDRARLDQLVDLIGELVICESMMFEDAAPTQPDARAAERSEANRNQLRKITRELQELGLALRMVPISGVFQKVTRMVRDLSKKLNKAVDLKLEGEETELDKTVVDQVADPLVHIVRNSLDHGIEESAADRIAAGKPARATITLRAFHQAGNVCIEIQDDGRGLNRQRILAKARERGLIGETQQLKDDEICNLVFAAGFSTAAQVTDISGRGVGMDVVRRNIEALRGCVELSSVEGQGTTLTLRLPLTMGLIDGMIVQAGGERFIVPTSSIVELIRPAPDQIARVQGQAEVLAVRGRNVPVFHLGETFDIAEDETAARNSIIVVVEDKDRQAGIAVDRILGQQQVVIKSLGELSKSDGLAGCAVLPDGRVGLILDVPGTLNAARRRQPA